MCNDVIQLCLLKKSWKMRIMVIDRNDNHIFLRAYPHSNIPFVLFLCFTPFCYRSTSKRVLQHNQKDDRGGEMWWELYGGVVQSMKMKDMKSLKWWTKFIHNIEYHTLVIWSNSCESQFARLLFFVVFVSSSLSLLQYNMVVKFFSNGRGQ